MDPLSTLGAACLVGATLPQATHLVRGAPVDGFAWSFVALNLVGLILLAARSGQLGEWAFFAVNVLGAAFWLLVFVRKSLRAGSPGGESFEPGRPIARP